MKLELTIEQGRRMLVACSIAMAQYFDAAMNVDNMNPVTEETRRTLVKGWIESFNKTLTLASDVGESLKEQHEGEVSPKGVDDLVTIGENAYTMLEKMKALLK